jgi:predicted permease
MAFHYVISPAFIALLITGLLILSVLIILIKNYKEVSRIDTMELLSFMCIMSITIGSHGLLHLGLEDSHGFNPLHWLNI